MGGRAGKSGLNTQMPNIPNTPMMPPPDEEEEEEEEQAAEDQQNSQDNTTPDRPPLGVTASELQQAYANGDEAEIERILTQATTVDVPDYLNTHHFQRFAYGLGMNDKPQVIPDSQFDALARQGNTVMYRSVGPGTTQSGVNLSSQDIAEQILSGDETYHGTGVYGDGLYFGKNLTDSKLYARGRTGQNSYVKAMINPNTAKSIDYNRLLSIQRGITSNRVKRGLSVAQNNGSLSSYGSDDASLPHLATMLGYNVINIPSRGYSIVLDRSALIMSDKVTKF